MITDLPRDVAEEVLSRLEVTSLGGVRSTCKEWNTLTKDEGFIKKLGKSQWRKVVMLLDCKVYLMRVDLLTPSIERIGKLVSLNHDPVVNNIYKTFHCEGLLLCITEDITNHLPRAVVWNPYSGQTRWIAPPRDFYSRFDVYALGYEKNCSSLLRSHKVLRFVDFFDQSLKRRVREYELYSFNSNSWKVVVDGINPYWRIGFYQPCVSLKGNTYWLAQKKLIDVGQGTEMSDVLDVLLCFDFTKERFGPHLPLPFHSFGGNIVNLSSVREEQLAVLFQKHSLPYTVKIWISSKIEPNAVSWNKLFLSVDMKPFTGSLFLDNIMSFFVDEEEEMAVVLDKAFLPTHNIVYIIGKNGHFQQVDLGGAVDPSLDLLTSADSRPLVSSYVPSSVEIM